MMGSDTGESNEQPVHAVKLDAFWLYQIEVTNKMYAACVSARVCSPPPDTGSATHSNYYGNPDFDDYPVIFVSWRDATTYCEWAGGRLPTEAEWEKAARGTDQRTFPWGSAAPDDHLLNYNNNLGDTTAVGSYPEGASFYGAHDMAGNVWEWVNDKYDLPASDTYYEVSPSYNPLGLETGSFRTIRGGSWYEPAKLVTSTLRLFGEPRSSDFYLGFRCAVDDSPAMQVPISPTQPSFSFADLNIEPLLIQPGDLPDGYSGGGITYFYTPNGIFDNAPGAEKLVIQEIIRNGPAAGYVIVGLYKNLTDVDQAYESLSLLGSTSSTDPGVGEKSALYADSATNWIELIFTRCHSVAYIRLANPQTEEAITYAMSLDARLSEAVCPN